MTAVVGQRDGFGEGQAQVDGAGDPGGDLGDLDGVGEAGAEVVVFGGDEHLALAGEPAPRPGVLDAVEVALEAEPVGVGRLGAGAVPGPDGSGRAGGERGVEVGFAFLAGAGGSADVGVDAGVGLGDATVMPVEPFVRRDDGCELHDSRVPVRCDDPIRRHQVGWRR